MKNSLKLSFAVFIMGMVVFSSCRSSQAGKDADLYCNSINTIQDKVINQLDSFFHSTRYRQYSTAEYYAKAQQETIRQIEELKKLGAFENDNSLQISLLHVLNVVDKMLKEEGRIIKDLDEALLKKYDKTKIDELDSIENGAILKIQKAQICFDSVQVQFLTNYGFDVQTDTVQYTIKTDLE